MLVVFRVELGEGLGDILEVNDSISVSVHIVEEHLGSHVSLRHNLSDFLKRIVRHGRSGVAGLNGRGAALRLKGYRLA